MTGFDECVCSSSCGSVCWAVDRRCGLSGVWVAVSKGMAVVWVLDTALVAVFGVVVAIVGTVVDGDVAAERRGSELERGGWRLGWGAAVRSGSVCRLLRGAGGIFLGGEEVVVVVVNDVGVVDGGCASAVSGDVAGNGGSGGSITTVLGVV